MNSIKRQFQIHPPIVEGNFLARNEAVKIIRNGNKFIDNEQIRHDERNLRFHIFLFAVFILEVLTIAFGLFLVVRN
jgi:hypothetical protein